MCAVASARNGAGDFVIDPDEQVQSVVRLVFSQFAKRGSVSSLLKWLVNNDVKMPVRPHSGASRGELEWRKPNRVTLLNMLHHPIYAGAYRWGHREIDPRKKIPGKAEQPAVRSTQHDECRVLIRDRFPAYISWEEFETKPPETRTKIANASKMLFGSATRAEHIVGIGRMRSLRLPHARRLCQHGHGAAKSKTLRYSCQRRSNRLRRADNAKACPAHVLDAFVAERLLQAIATRIVGAEPFRRGRRGTGDEGKIDEHWQQRLARSRFEVEQARRQYSQP